MNEFIRNYPRSTCLIGGDATGEFLRRADNDRAIVEIWRISMSGQVFELQLMRMRRKTDPDPWVFGSITAVATKKQIWTFRDDKRVVDRGFVGDVFTIVGPDGLTYVSYQTFGQERYRILLSELLKVQQPPVIPLCAPPPAEVAVVSVVAGASVADLRPVRWTIPQQPTDQSDEMDRFVHQVLCFM